MFLWYWSLPKNFGARDGADGEGRMLRKVRRAHVHLVRIRRPGRAKTLLAAPLPTATAVAMEDVPRLLVSIGPPLAFTLLRGALVLPGIGLLALAFGFAILTFLDIGLALAAFSFAKNGSNLHGARVFRCR